MKCVICLWALLSLGLYGRIFSRDLHLKETPSAAVKNPGSNPGDIPFNNPPAVQDSNDIRVSGKITNQAGDPVQGVTVTVKGYTAGTASNASGEYNITVPLGSVLSFSSVGYETQEISVNEHAEINVILLNATKALEQVVVVGYGSQRKRDITGAVSSVKGDEILKQPVLTATQAIQGKVAGVQIISSGAPNSAPVVRIRGTGSILGGQNPLYVVDGVLTDDIRNINSADIISLEVLKDASSGAIYGVRAANGVIIITTKKGRGGKMTINYDANIGVRQAAHLVKMADANQYAKYLNDASINGSIIVDPSLTSTSTDWFDQILRTAFQQNHNISVSGGSDKINYFFSFGYLTDQGIVIDNKFERFTLRSNNEYKLSGKLKVNTLVSYSRGTTQDVNLGSAYNNAYHAAPVIPSKVNGLYGNTSAYQNVGNPVLDIESNDNRFKENRLQATGYIEYKPITWLTLRTSYGIDLGFNDRRNYTYQFINDTSTFLTSGGNQKNLKSSLNVENIRNNRWVWDNTATFQRTFNKNDFILLAGTTAEREFNESNTGFRSDVPSDPSLWYLNLGDPASQLNGASASLRTRNSYLGRLNYVYDKKYLLTATIRADGTSEFITHRGYFPAVGIGWNITSEDFMQKQKIFDNLKLRASWGKLGNDNIPSAARFATLRTGLAYYFNGTLVSGSNLLDFIDKQIKWEATKETDIGLEFGMLKNRLSGEVDLYDKKVDNALIRVPIATAPTGDPDGLYITNVASFENKGVELSLTWNDKAGKNINYNISGNISYNRNKILALNAGQPIPEGNVGSKGNTTLTTNNTPIGSFYLLQADGVIHNQTELSAYTNSAGIPVTIEGAIPALGDLKYKDINDDGKIDDKDKVFSGSYQPKVIIGFNAGISYKAFDLSVNAYAALGSKIYNAKKAARFNSKDNVEASVTEDYWTFANYTTNQPRANLNAIPNSTYFLESGDFLRINNLAIGYTFPKRLLSKFGISSFRCYLTSQNLATFTKYSGFTPELSEDNPLRQGLELNAYPTTRTYAFGVNLTF